MSCSTDSPFKAVDVIGLALAFGISPKILPSVIFKFSLLKNGDERASFALNLLKDEDIFTHSSYKGLKSVSRSVELRKKGNEAVIRKDYESALLLYSESIAYAPFPSDKTTERADVEADSALSLAIANRSAVFFALGNYESCLDSIDFALETNYPNELSQKLHIRREKCLEALEERNVLQIKKLSLSKMYTLSKLVTSNKHFEDAKISYGMNAELPSCSDCVELKVTSDMGRGLFATRDIKIGDVIIIEKPFSSSLGKENFYRCCHNCFKHSNSLIPCRHCSVAMFCSKECYDTSWELYHSIECSILPLLLQKEVYSIGALPLRTVIISSKKFESVDDFYKAEKSWEKNVSQKEDMKECSEYFEVYNLAVLTFPPELLFIFHVYGAFLSQFLEKKTNFFATSEKSENKNMHPVEQLKFFITSLVVKHVRNQPHGIEIFQAMKHNGIIDGFKYILVGSGIYLTASLINHSCDPNVFHYTDFKNHIIVRALCSVKQGEQIFDSYGPLHGMLTRKERRVWLSRYGFTCQCIACTENWPLTEELKYVVRRYKCRSCSSILPPKLGVAVACSECRSVNNIQSISSEITKHMKTIKSSVQQTGIYLILFLLWRTFFPVR